MIKRWFEGTPPIHAYALERFLEGPRFRQTPRGWCPVPSAVPAGVTHACPFLIPGYTIHVADGWEVVSAGEQVVALYRADHSLRVRETHQGNGLGAALMVWRSEHRGHRPYDVARSDDGIRCARAAHRLAVQRALNRGEPVASEVLSDYPTLKGE